MASYICILSSSSSFSVVGADASGGQQQQRQQQQQQREQQQQHQPQQQSAGKLRSLGEVALSERRYDDAENHYLSAIKIEPNNPVNHHRLYVVRKRRGNNYLGVALGDIANAVELDPTKYDYRYQKAALLVQLGRCDEANVEYRAAHDLAGDDESGRHAASEGMRDATECANYANAANQAYDSEHWEQAARYLDVVLRYTLDAPDLLYLKATSEYNMMDYYGTVSDTGKILKNYPKHIEAYQLRGDAYARLNEMDMAVKHYREGLKLDPEHKGEFVSLSGGGG